jgi:hypothetical protein
MAGTANVFRQLTSEWADLGDSPAARASMAAWAAPEPVLDRFDSPAQVVVWCQQPGHSADANAIVAALVRLADDPLAARTVLQAILPALAERAWRASWSTGSSGGSPWESMEELNVHVVGLAFERIRLLAGTTMDWPVTTIVDRVWRRIRTLRDAAVRDRGQAVGWDAAPEVASAVEPTVADRLTAELVRAVRDGRLRRADAGVIFTSRVLGYDPAELALRQRRDVRAVRKQRARAERALLVAGL